MKSSMLIITTMLILLSGNAAVFSADQPDSSQNSYDQYKVIFERNIFSKDRLPPREIQVGGGRVKKTQVLAIYILRGIAVQKEEKVAFIEEQVSGQTTRAEIGSEVLNGRITDIKYDRVAFEQNGQIKYIKVGGEFGKTETTVTVEVSEESQETTSVEKPADDSTASDENDILKKLMERRKSELGQ